MPPGPAPVTLWWAAPSSRLPTPPPPPAPSFPNSPVRDPSGLSTLNLQLSTVMSRTAAILLAAGSSRRMAGAVSDKILAPLAGKPVFAHSAATFVRSGVADFFVVTYRDQAQMVGLSAYVPTPTVFVHG